MSKSTITRLFVGACVALVIGLVVGLAALVLAVARGVVTVGGPDIVTVDGGALAGLLVWLVIASLIGGGGAIAAVVAWVGALLNTVRLDDKTWFGLLLVLGLCSFGWLAMAAYVVAGPDGMAPGTTDRGVETLGQP